MNLRSSFLLLVATPDRAWLVLLAGALLIARECTGPGRILPGLIGGIAVLTAGNALLEFGFTATGLLLLAVAMLLGWLEAVRGRYHIPMMAAAVCTVFAARLLVAPPWQISWAAAAAGAPVMAILAWLASVGVRARRNKQDWQTGRDASR